LAYLAANPEARQKAREVALMILAEIGKALEPLAKLLHDRFVRGWDIAMTAVHDVVATAFNGLVTFVRGIVGTIEDIILAIPRAVAKALAALGLLNAAGENIARKQSQGAFDLKDMPGHASGGWVGLHGPELGLLGEKGPEYIVPNHQLGKTGTTGFTIAGISE